MHAQRIRRIFPLILFVIVVVAATVYLSSVAGKEPEGLRASGTVETVEVIIAPQAAGRIAEVMAAKGDQVAEGDALLRLEDDLLQAQRKRAVTAVETAQAQVDVARAALTAAEAGRDTAQRGSAAAQIQYEAAVLSANQLAQPTQTAAWNQTAPDSFTLPNYYFTQKETLAAAEAELAAAEAELAKAETAVAGLSLNGEMDEFIAAEERLAQAQAHFLVGQSVLAQAQTQSDSVLQAAAKGFYDMAAVELREAQEAYGALLGDEAAADLLAARSELAVAQARVDAATGRRDQLLMGEASPSVRAAAAARDQAEAAAAQAEAAVTQAQAGLALAEKMVAQARTEVDLVDVQLERLVVRAPLAGVILNRAVETGELVQPGTVAMILGQMDELTITVFLPEDHYGQVNLGQPATVTVDSFPSQEFSATIVRIADRAEFTPRNVQTAEGRRTTVFAITLAVDDPGGELKPGMPADVDFES